MKRAFRKGIGVAICVLLASVWRQAPAFAQVPGTGPDEGHTVVYRDEWGVAHIYAPTMTAGVYAQGWAQAQDRPQELLKNFLRAMGESARVDGPAALPNDLVARIWDHYGTAKRLADQIDPTVRSHIRAYVQGVNDYYAAHPEDVPVWWGDRQVDEYMAIAFGRLFLYAWSIEQAFADLKRAGVEPQLGEYHHGSNEWAVAPSRSAAGAAILVIDPHLSWWGLSRFWEFRVHAGDWHGSGFTLPGSPYVGLGHTDYCAWAMTTGGPDTADVYALTLNPDDPTQYRYEGAWRQMTSRDITIEVAGQEPHRITVWDSHYGPVIGHKGDTAYAAKTAYADSVRSPETWYRFNTATDYTGMVDAMAMLQLFPQNVMIADTSGNIYYQRTGRVPVRPEGYDWSKPVDGSTAATEWHGVHSAAELVQITNPPQGFMQNCNIPPDAMMPDSPLTPDRYPADVYSDAIYGPPNGWTNQRAGRAVELLANDAAVSPEAARVYALDVRPYGIDRWIDVLRRADRIVGVLYRKNADYAAGVADVLDWDGELRRDSTAALKYAYWRKQGLAMYGKEQVEPVMQRVDAPWVPVGETLPPFKLTREEMQGACAAFAAAMEELKARHGSLDAVYGDLFRVGRGDASWPVGGGGDEELGLRTFRSIEFGPLREDGTRRGRAGQTSTQVVVMTSPPRSWTYTPVGESDRPAFVHFDDQAEKLFGPRRLKPTWYQPQALVGHIESRTVLAGAPTE